MKRTVHLADFRRAFVDYGRQDQFSDTALEMIFDYLESIEADTKIEFELDVVAICCEFTEYDDFAALKEAFDLDFDGCDDPEQIIDMIEREVTVIRRDYKSTDGPFVVNG